MKTYIQSLSFQNKYCFEQFDCLTSFYPPPSPIHFFLISMLSICIQIDLCSRNTVTKMHTRITKSFIDKTFGNSMALLHSNLETISKDLNRQNVLILNFPDTPPICFQYILCIFASNQRVPKIAFKKMEFFFLGGILTCLNAANSESTYNILIYEKVFSLFSNEIFLYVIKIFLD